MNTLAAVLLWPVIVYLTIGLYLQLVVMLTFLKNDRVSPVGIVLMAVAWPYYARKVVK